MSWFLCVAAMTTVLTCVFFGVVATCGWSSQAAGHLVNIDIDSLTYTRTDSLNDPSVNVTCLVVNRVSETFVKLGLFKDGELAVLFSGGNNSKRYDKFKHDGSVKSWRDSNGTNTMTYIRLTILQPETEDSGTYACGLEYLDQRGVMRRENDSDVFTVEPQHDVLRSVENILYKGGLIVDSAIGIPGNVLCFLVWRRHEKAYNSSGFYLATLGLTNVLFISLSLAYQLHNILTSSRVLDESALCNVFLVIIEFSRMMSVPLILGYTVERYISICHPFQRVFYCTRKRAKIICVCLTIVTLLLTCPYYYYGTVRLSKRQCEIVITKNMGSLIYMIVLHSVYILGGNCAILFFNTLVIVELKRGASADKERCRSEVGSRFEGDGAEKTKGGREGGGERRQRRNDKDNTNVLLALSCYQVVTTMPLSLLCILAYIYTPPLHPCQGEECVAEQLTHDSTAISQAYVFAWLFESTHHAFDILLYVLTGRTFRRTLKQLLTCSHRD